MKTRTGLEVMNLEFIVRLKIMRNEWWLADRCPQAVILHKVDTYPQAANQCALFESETVLKFYNLVSS